ncbi:ribonuclease H-like domain-containing protein [Auriculariales sp. MPI-PUGE-AT-0066]|nr:ribonuclease H-like domain-containing protein [Auriculariales sp. MPI-PUGE-AT-0066]
MQVNAEPSTSNWTEYQARLQNAVLQPTKLALGLPKDLQFHRTLDRQFGEELDACSTRVLSIANKLINLAAGGRELDKKVLGGDDDAKDNFHSLVVDVMDRLLERADTCIDQHLGRNKAATSALAVADDSNRAATHAPLSKKLLHDHTIAKPQLGFSKSVDNFVTTWKPALTQKYFSKQPLDDVDAMETDDGPYHPYRFDITNVDYPEHIFASPTLSDPASFDSVPFTLVTKPPQFTEMLNKLKKANEIAVDLEHHSYRSYGGFLCLMQLSTRGEDFVVDLLAVRDEVPALAEVFANPAIVKIFHGAESDIVWLQQDFSIYVVNLFDTYHASKVLEFAKHSLAKLLETYTSFIPDKRYQLADWRIRPLPAEMLLYARSDTHFLLHIYDRLRAALFKRADGKPDLIREVLRRSEETALRTYSVEVYDAENGLGQNGWENMAKKWNRGLHGAQLAVYKAVHRWRDNVARREDESTRYVMGNNTVFKLADVRPSNMQELTATIHPMNAIQRRHTKDLLQCIVSAVAVAQEPAAIEPVLRASNEPNPFAIGTQSLPIDLTGDFEARTKQLWDYDRSDELAPRNVASKSSLFGEAFVVPNWKSYTKSTSTLFGATASKANRKREEYLEVAAEIHASLVVAPTLPKLEDVDMSMRAGPSAPSGQAPPPAGDGEFIPIPTAPQEIPFVPKAERKTTTVFDPNFGDEIVVVGQRHKKRKRTKPTAEGADAQTSAADVQPVDAEDAPKIKKAKKEKLSANPAQSQDDQMDTGDGEDEVKEFDYSAAANIFEQPPEDTFKSANSKKGKGKEKGKNHGKASTTPNIEYGNFPKPPRARAEMKAGNMSRTFR